MDAKRMSEILNGREYREEITDEQAEVAHASGLVVIYGYSDDGVEIRGAVCDEVDAWNGTEFFIKGEHIINFETLINDVDNSEYSDYLRDLIKKEFLTDNVIKADFDKDGYTWVISTKLPHETFEIFEDGEKFCKGIVIDIKNL